MAYRMQSLVGIGAVVVFIGLILIFIGFLNSSKDPKSGTKVAIGGFIGPIPFWFWKR